MGMKSNGEKTAAIVLAAGRGSRMGGDIHKQFMLLGGRPLVYYSLKAFAESAVDEIVLVTGEEDIVRCEEIVRKYNIAKVKAVVPGGRERYDSVYEGLKAADTSSYVLIHDGARPFLTDAIIGRCMDGAREYGACVAAMPVKDTIKIADEAGFADYTPNRNLVWMMQTPQAFSYPLVRGAYDCLASRGAAGLSVTDDAMVVETFTDHKVKFVEGSYRNIKVTTPEDMLIGEAFLNCSRSVKVF